MSVRDAPVDDPARDCRKRTAEACASATDGTAADDDGTSEGERERFITGGTLEPAATARKRGLPFL
jgi:hypothetical protein